MVDMNEKDIIGGFEKIAEYKPGEDSAGRDLQKVRDMLTSQHARIAPERETIWRIIMKSKITKLAAAAVIIIAVLIGINQFVGSIDMANIAFANVRAKVGEAGWMHLKGSSVEPDGEKVKSEVWLSAKKQIIATKRSDLSIAAWIDYANKQRQIYKEDANELTLMGTAKRSASGEVAIWDYLNLWLGNEMLGKARIEEHTEVIDGVAFRVYDLLLSEDAGTCDMKIVTDAQTNLPISIVIKAENSAGEKSSAEFKCEYIDAGPENIYTLGVPSDAKVIDMLPGVGIKELAEIFNEKRERFSPYIFFCVQPSQGTIVVNYIKGDTFDAGKYFKYAHYAYWIPNNYKICDEIEDGVFEFAENLHKRSDAQFVSATLWDGKRQHQVDYPERSVSKSRSSGNVRSVGHFWPLSGMVGRIKEDDYSKSHNLIAVRTGRILRHFDPLHDYVCVRYESRIEDGKILLREMGDLVQTEEGYWYPRSETGTVISFDDDGNEISRRVSFVHKYFIEKIANCRDDYFDVDKNMSRILERKNK